LFAKAVYTKSTVFNRERLISELPSLIESVMKVGAQIYAWTGTILTFIGFENFKIQEEGQRLSLAAILV